MNFIMSIVGNVVLVSVENMQIKAKKMEFLLQENLCAPKRVDAVVTNVIT